ncbi:hypothetical protein TL16_g05271 [Triparma laevis f. inornata]|uniref:GxGYxYP putative glycoside hydrolase C-terminal domain-containing protein n=1 Tax=Triparma laevis f. inornata TaxID=1714386 RepID=A0A9W7AKA9_9STRA|nr:hypothetical protein TL16_g05271 [Triparma laevis f. inornata]
MNRVPGDGATDHDHQELFAEKRPQYYANLSVNWQSNSNEWLDAVTEGTNTEIILNSVDDLLEDCYNSHDLVKGYIKYNYDDQKLVVPNLVTLSGVLDAVLLDSSFLDSFDDDLPMIFDAMQEWADFDATDATEYMYDNYITHTNGLVKSNPGFDSSTNPTDPDLNGYMNAALVDFIVSNKMFNFYLTEGCIPLTRDHELMKRIAAYEGFEKPTAVWGYDSTFSYVAGSKFEAETDCVNTLGQNACFPLAWSMSPQLLHFAPQLISWWYDAFKTTGTEYFVLPPSGELYSYPGGFSNEDQIKYKNRMQSVAGLMNISGTIHWEFPVFSTWKNALPYFEKYAEDENPGVNGFHCVNVPYFEPILEIFGASDRKVLNDKVVLFKSIEWRGGNSAANDWSAADFAKKSTVSRPEV